MGAKVLHTPKLYDLRSTSYEKFDENTKETRIVRNLYLMMEYVECDLKKILVQQSSGNFTEDHLLLTIYNILCGV